MLWILSGIVGEVSDFGLRNYSSLLRKDIAQGASHGQTWVSLVENPDALRAKLHAWFGWNYRARPLYGLDNQRLVIGVIDLTIILV